MMRFPFPLSLYLCRHWAWDPGVKIDSKKE